MDDRRETGEPDDELARMLADLFERMEQGDEEAKNAVFQLLYEDLYRRAARHMRGQPKGITLSPSDLLGELYLKLMHSGRRHFLDSAHFLGFCAKVMRHVLIDYARRKNSQKRGGDREREGYEGITFAGEGIQVDILDLHHALEKLDEINPEAAQVIELKFFGKVTTKQIAEIMGRSTTWVDDKLAFARAWLRSRLGD
ncbi:MAG: ECF-type sigma factor [Planctomycetota bacterium]|nr:ECF-type sigma factor [Planctomycetota bacterium]